MDNVNNINEQEPKENQGFWRPANIVLLSILALIIAGGVYFTLNFLGPMPTITVLSEHQQCDVDDDCVNTGTQCSCDCGTAVNKEFSDYYLDQLDKACDNYQGRMCSMICDYEITCDNGVCAKHEINN